MSLPQTISPDALSISRIVTELAALLGLTAGHAPARIAPNLRQTVLRLLRPAESAVRRLILILAQVITLKPYPAPTGFARGTERKLGAHFALFDPRQRFFAQKRNVKIAPKAQPRITFFDGGETRILALSGQAPAKPVDHGLIASSGLVHRLTALQYALGDLPRQARRLARTLARRAQSARLKGQSPLRTGAAPGYRRRPSHEIDRILERWQERARIAQEERARIALETDTS